MARPADGADRGPPPAWKSPLPTKGRGGERRWPDRRSGPRGHRPSRGIRRSRSWSTRADSASGFPQFIEFLRRRGNPLRLSPPSRTNLRSVLGEGQGEGLPSRRTRTRQRKRFQTQGRGWKAASFPIPCQAAGCECPSFVNVRLKEAGKHAFGQSKRNYFLSRAGQTESSQTNIPVFGDRGCQSIASAKGSLLETQRFQCPIKPPLLRVAFCDCSSPAAIRLVSDEQTARVSDRPAPVRGVRRTPKSMIQRSEHSSNQLLPLRNGRDATVWPPVRVRSVSSLIATEESRCRTAPTFVVPMN